MRKILFALFFPMLLSSQSLVSEMKDLFQAKRYSEARDMLLPQLENEPDDPLLVELIGDSYGHEKKWDEAITYYEKLVSLYPNNANYHYKHGGALGMKALSISKIRALPMLGDIKFAFLKAAELDPKHIETRWALVELYIQLPGIVGGSNKKALSYAEELMNISLVDGYLAKGYVYENTSEPELAEYNFKRAIEVGGSINCYEKLTNFYETYNQPEKAIENLEEAYKRHNSNMLHYQLGKVCAVYNVQIEKGERCLKTFINNHSARDGVPIEWGYLRLAQIYKNKNDKDQALAYVDKALAVRKNFKQAKKEKEVILEM